MGICAVFNIFSSEDTIAGGWVIDENVRYSSYELAIPDYRRARHECGQVGRTLFNGKFTKSAESNQAVTLGGNVIHGVSLYYPLAGILSGSSV